MSLFFVQETCHGAAKTNDTCLAWTHVEMPHRVLGVHLVYQLRERIKPLGGRAAAAHVGFCVFVLLCVVLGVPFTLIYLTGGKLISPKAKWPTFAHS